MTIPFVYRRVPRIRSLLLSNDVKILQKEVVIEFMKDNVHPTHFCRKCTIITPSAKRKFTFHQECCTYSSVCNREIYQNEINI